VAKKRKGKGSVDLFDAIDSKIDDVIRAARDAEYEIGEFRLAIDGHGLKLPKKAMDAIERVAESTNEATHAADDASDMANEIRDQVESFGGLDFTRCPFCGTDRQASIESCLRCEADDRARAEFRVRNPIEKVNRPILAPATTRAPRGTRGKA